MAPFSFSSRCFLLKMLSAQPLAASKGSSLLFGGKSDSNLEGRRSFSSGKCACAAAWLGTEADGKTGKGGQTRMATLLRKRSVTIGNYAREGQGLTGSSYLCRHGQYGLEEPGEWRAPCPIAEENALRKAELHAAGR